MKNYSLSNRANSFANVIHETVYTNSENATIDTEQGFLAFTSLMMNARNNNHCVYLIGNGGSAAVASHAITDFVNVCHLRAFTLHDSALITCMSNDFGYEVAFERIINTCLREGDILICISSSGRSVNIHNGAKAAKAAGAHVITLSGFNADNPLRQLGDMNFWLSSNDYGLVEIGHLFLLHNIADRISAIEKQENETNADADAKVNDGSGVVVNI